MGCNGNGDSLMNQLKDLVCQIDNDKPCCQTCCGPPLCTGTTPAVCCPPCPCPEACCPNFPFATVTMTAPPPIILPTVPTPVKPLQMPCPCPQDDNSYLLDTYDRFDNYYNSYNNNWRNEGVDRPYDVYQRPGAEYGVALDGKCPVSGYVPKKNNKKGCPTGFKPCRMKLKPPPLCDPCGVWCAEVQPCPPKYRKCHPRPPECR